MARPWKRCSSCKKPIPVGGRYYSCSVSTCNRVRDPKVFCSMGCFDAHLPVMNHRTAYFEEKTAPSSLQASRTDAQPAAAATTRRRAAAPGAAAADGNADEILVIASRLKDYIRAQSGMNTSSDVLPVLSDHLRLLALEAIEAAREDGRRTVKGRDVRKPLA